MRVQPADDRLERSDAGVARGEVAPFIVHQVLDSPGQPLDLATRAYFESRFEHSFSEVRVHSDARAAESARALSALAYAVGNRVVFGAGEYRPHSWTGRQLLGHELAHLLQQRIGGEESTGAEREAARAGALSALGLPAPRRVGAPAGVPQASPISDDVEAAWLASSDKARVFDRLRALSPAPTDTDLTALLRRIFVPGSDDLWLAKTLQQHGPEPLWPAAALDERGRRALQHGWADEPGAIEASLGTTAGSRSVRAYYFRGTTDERALVIGGVHGSEQSGVEVVEMLRTALLTGPRPYYTVILVPVLFPDNYAVARREGATPTNRNFPAPGSSLPTAGAATTTGPVDELGRGILPENVMLMELIERFRPSRIASVHATHRAAAAGIFSDPHRVSPAAAAGAATSPLVTAFLHGFAAIRTAADQQLALDMAAEAERRGARVPGNLLGTAAPSAGWSGGSPGGTSLGEWGPTDISEGGPADRASMTVITVEVSGTQDTRRLRGAARTARLSEFEAHRDVLRDIFLGPP